MGQRILLVDDEPGVLDGLRRQLASRYTVEAVLSGAEGLKKLDHSRGSSNPFAVVVSDMMMPEMDGAEFLGRAAVIAPDAVLMVLSGKADLRSTISAVNTGRLFRFIPKPCSPRDLQAAIDAALVHYRRSKSEGDLLEKTLAGSVKVLAQALAMASPETGARITTITELVGGAARRMGQSNSWELRMAARLSQLGLVSIPPDVLQRVEGGIEGSAGEKAMYRAHPSVARDLLAGVPKLERVAAWVGGQTVDATAPPPRSDPDPDSRVELQRQIFQVAAEFLAAKDIGEWPPECAARLAAGGRYRRDVVQAVLETALERDAAPDAQSVTINQLAVGMRFVRDVKATTGAILVRKGDRVTDAVRVRLQNFKTYVGVVEPLRVTQPKDTL
ncbi:response regulator [Cryptosporangium aurantiacum]|uniref:Response regulator c-di-GMP phosphodiesterase, RpfG family, contains REC and HD-GYP domains n=1 Tax=Cryptosporangium aurantiacum TaxID=134849 RepID=A0A1M7RBM1_9ACTN|nr:response regulator [Cryptosporangium aurantiacum]SHN43458.1 Response regulator c-di-GMP phosphodiesterase, RpfG family, contains REC and HD-GYP domains [Cryptosporangium aurantiacum]